MNVHHTLICFFFLCTTEFVTAGIWVVPEGGNLSIYNYFTVSGSTKFFCKEKCERAEDILIKTDGTTAQSSRYSIKYRNASSGRGRLSFTITHMTKSDSGMYRFGLGKSLVPESYSDFEARVSNDPDKNSGVVRAQTVGEEIQFPCSNAVHGTRKFLCKNQCEKEGDVLIDTMKDTAQSGRFSIRYTKGSVFGLYATITNLTKSDTGTYRCGYGNPLSPDSYDTDDIFVIDDLDKNSGFFLEQTVGEEIQFPCSNTVHGTRKFLCKNRCEKEGEILVDTMNDTAQSGRFSIRYIKGSVFGLYATITNLTKSDTGTYRCGYGNPLSPDSYDTDDIFVIDASNPPTSTPQTATQSQSFTSGISTPSSDCSGSSLSLVVCASLVGVLLLAVFLLLLYIFKMRRNAGLNTRENTDDINMENVHFENCTPASTFEDSTYQTLDAASRDLDQTYSTLTHQT